MIISSEISFLSFLIPVHHHPCLSFFLYGTGDLLIIGEQQTAELKSFPIYHFKFETGFTKLSRLALNLYSFCFSLESSWDRRLMQIHLGTKLLFYFRFAFLF